MNDDGPKRKSLFIGDDSADAREATRRAKELDPSAFAYMPKVWSDPRDRCQIRIETDDEWDDDGTQVVSQAIAASGRTFGEALGRFAMWIEERRAKEARGNETQRKLREAGKA